MADTCHACTRCITHGPITNEITQTCKTFSQQSKSLLHATCIIMSGVSAGSRGRERARPTSASDVCELSTCLHMDVNWAKFQMPCRKA